MAPKIPDGLNIHFDSVVLDCLVAHDLAIFYSNLLGWPIAHETPDFSAVKSPDGAMYIYCQFEPDYESPVWPTQKGKPQMTEHLDFGVNDLNAGVKHALNCGAALSPVQYLDTVRICIDPAGHPFCLCGE
ncbi:MAG TPA: VOC family protein [Clostridia bacterium]|nr:VOC family protein [Clostridia bacterium]